MCRLYLFVLDSHLATLWESNCPFGFLLVMFLLGSYPTSNIKSKSEQFTIKWFPFALAASIYTLEPYRWFVVIVSIRCNYISSTDALKNN